MPLGGMPEQCWPSNRVWDHEKMLKNLFQEILSWFGIRRFCFLAGASLWNVDNQEGVWRSDANAPSFVVDSQSGLPHGWVEFKFKIESLDKNKLKPFFVIRLNGKGASERREVISISQSGEVRHLMNIPSTEYSITFIPADGPCYLRLGEGTIRSISKLELAFRLSISLIKQRIFMKRSIISVLKNGFFLIRRRKFKELRSILMRAHQDSKKPGNYAVWIEEIEPRLLASLPAHAIAALKHEAPTISVLISTYNTPPAYLRTAIESVINQSYCHWELCIVDDKSDDKVVRDIIEEYASKDSRVNFHFRETNGHISASLNTALSMATGSFFTVLAHDDCLARRALEWIAVSIVECPDVDYLYSDEDKISATGERLDPFFKPDWSPEYMLSSIYTCHMSVFRTSLVKDLGAYRSASDGAQDYDLALRVVARTNSIIHIPHILYHWRVWCNSTAMSLSAKPYAYLRQRQALTEYLQQKNESFTIMDHPLNVLHRVVFGVKRQSLVSIVIPTANGKVDPKKNSDRHIDLVVESIKEKTTYAAYEIVIVHNGDLTPEQVVRFEGDPIIKVVHYSESVFSLSRKINLGVDSAKGEFILLLNDDIRIIT